MRTGANDEKGETKKLKNYNPRTKKQNTGSKVDPYINHSNKHGLGAQIS